MVSATGDAWRAAEQAQESSGVRIRLLEKPSDLSVAVRIFDQVWPPDSGTAHLKTNFLRAIVHAGGYVAAAFDSDRPVAAALAMCGRHPVGHGPPHESASWRQHLHSDMAGVVAGYRDRSIGTALKRHQRAWALAHGIDTIVWSFDPLVRRNARFNIRKLGAEVRGYEPNFYGAMDDAINAGDPTDRVFAWWILQSEAAIEATREPLATVDPSTLRQARVIKTPEDIVSLRTSSRESAMQWRLSVREQFMSALDAGLRVVGLDSEGSFVLAMEGKE